MAARLTRVTMRRRLTRVIALGLAGCASLARLTPPAAAAAVAVTYDAPVTIRADEGPLSFGTVLSLDVVSWSAPSARDLLISRLWDGVYLYPSQDLQGFGVPVKLCDSLGQEAFSVVPLDWNGDGIQEAFGVERLGRLSSLRRTGVFPALRLEFAGYLRQADGGLQMRVPYDNPEHRLGNANGYIGTAIFNYVWATPYPGGAGQAASLILGDWAGRLWWLPQRGMVDGLPAYPGQPYQLPKGEAFARPALQPLDEDGHPFLLGQGVEDGQHYRGCQTRPLAYRNPQTGSDDLLVRAGMLRQELHYLRRLSAGPAGAPVFRNLGEVDLEGGDPHRHGLFSRLALVPGDGWDDLLSSDGSSVAIYRNQRLPGEKPAFTFTGYIRGKDVPTAGTDFVGVFTDADGRRFVLDAGDWQFRQILKTPAGFQLASDRLPLEDQNGRFHLTGETDPNYSSGFDRAALWDYDGSGRQHLVIGADTGALYLLRQDEPLGSEGRFRFTRLGPLRDRTDQAIKVHNRVAVAPLDLDGDGRLDLVLAGATYQNGSKTDPTPGAGVYYSLVRGLGANGLPLLEPVQPLETVGHVHALQINQHAQLQALDLYGTGERVVVVATQEDGFRGHVYRPATGRIALEATGTVLPRLAPEARILDIDGDGLWEYVDSGSETQIGSCAKLVFTR
jgi:hypothetical protein